MNDAVSQRRWTAASGPLERDDQPTVRSVVADLRKVPRARTDVTALIIVWAILFARFSWEAPISIATDGSGEWHFPARSGEPRAAVPIATSG